MTDYNVEYLSKDLTVIRCSNGRQPLIISYSKMKNADKEDMVNGVIINLVGSSFNAAFENADWWVIIEEIRKIMIKNRQEEVWDKSPFDAKEKTAFPNIGNSPPCRHTNIYLDIDGIYKCYYCGTWNTPIYMNEKTTNR